MNSIHAHDVMEMMLASGKIYTRESLIADMAQKFGADARFCSCSAENMTPEQLVAFLESRGKFVPRSGGFQTSTDAICPH